MCYIGFELSNSGYKSLFPIFLLFLLFLMCVMLLFSVFRYATNILCENNMKSSHGIISVNKPVLHCFRIYTLSEILFNE